MAQPSAPLWEILEELEAAEAAAATAADRPAKPVTVDENDDDDDDDDEHSRESSPATKRARIMEAPMMQRHLNTHAAAIRKNGALTWVNVLKHGFDGQVEAFIEKQKEPVRLQTACSGTGCAKIALEASA